MSFCEWYVNGLDIAINAFGWCVLTYYGIKACYAFKAMIDDIVYGIINKGEEEDVEMGE